MSGYNVCGGGPSSPAFEVTVNPIPPVPAITLDGGVLTSSAPAGNQWYFSDNTDGTFVMIPGETGQTYIAETTGYYYDVVTLNDCSSSPSNIIFVVVTDVPVISDAQASIYPVPNNGLFKVSLTSPTLDDYSITVMNNLGVKIYNDTKVKMTSFHDHIIDLRPVAAGVYLLVIQNKSSRLMKKILVGR